MATSLLTIGTEITTGETLNSNAQWVSGRLEDLGHEVHHHLAVPDDKLLMHQALDFLKESTFVFVTGGLGPTQDDLTREVVARWAGQKLKFSEEAWVHLQQRAKDKGIPIREGHKHQCYFPESAQQIPNDVGSALGFIVKTATQKIFVLPGPPRELKEMWTKSVEPLIGRGPLSPWVKWVIQDLRESEVAERFEKVLAQFVDPKKIEIGYRASPPLIHVKVRANFVPKGFSEAIATEFSGHFQKPG